MVSTASFATVELFYFMASVPTLDAAVQKHPTTDQSTLYATGAQTGVAQKSRGGHLFAKGFTALAFTNNLCFFYDFPIPLCVVSMLRI
jgi:hypothetical protein